MEFENHELKNTILAFDRSKNEGSSQQDSWQVLEQSHDNSPQNKIEKPLI
jgi:hypothetical protein